MTDAPLGHFTEVVDKNRRWMPDWYSWLFKLVEVVNALGVTVSALSTSVTDLNDAVEEARFFAFNSATDATVTGDGTVVTVDFDTEVTDTHSAFASDTFTAPFAGVLRASGNLALSGLTAGTHVIVAELVTTSHVYQWSFIAAGTSASVPFSVEVAPMALGDTAFMRLTVTGGAKNVNVSGHATVKATFFQGALTR